MTQFIKLVELAREYDLSIRDVQECARKLGLPWSKGVTMLNGGQQAAIRPALADEQRTRRWQKSRRAEVVEHGDVVHVECACCQLTLDCRADTGAAFCDACRNHFSIPGEDINRKIARLTDHDQRMRNAYVAARTAFYEGRGATARALQNRDDWKEVATKLVRDHIAGPRGQCDKCKHEFPCETVRIMQSVNSGFYRYAAGLAGYSDDEVGRHTNPRRAPERDFLGDIIDGTA
jgi:hypothetical protein